MFAFACIAGGLIVACTVFALFVPAGPEVTLSATWLDKLETMHRSHNGRRARQPGNCDVKSAVDCGHCETP